MLSDERKKALKDLICRIVDDDVLNEYDALEIIEVCQKACEREEAQMMEDMLKDLIVDGTDAGPQ